MDESFNKKEEVKGSDETFTKFISKKRIISSINPKNIKEIRKWCKNIYKQNKDNDKYDLVHVLRK